MQVDQDRLKTENANLVTAFREKSRKHQQTQELYDRLKRKEMTAATQSAAYESVDEVLGASIRQGQDFTGSVPQFRNQFQHEFPHVSDGLSGGDHIYNSHRDDVENGNRKGGMMPPPPPPPRRPAGYANPGFTSGKLSHSRAISFNNGCQ